MIIISGPTQSLHVLILQLEDGFLDHLFLNMESHTDNHL